MSDYRILLEDVKNGKVSIDDALLSLKKMPFEDLGFAKPDYHRSIRQGVPEVIYGAGKIPEQICSIASSLRKNGAMSIGTCSIIGAKL